VKKTPIKNHCHCPCIWVIHKEWVSSVLRPLQHSIGYTGDGFYRSIDRTNSIKVLKEISFTRTCGSWEAVNSNFGNRLQLKIGCNSWMCIYYYYCYYYYYYYYALLCGRKFLCSLILVCREATFDVYLLHRFCPLSSLTFFFPLLCAAAVQSHIYTLSVRRLLLISSYFPTTLWVKKKTGPLFYGL